jgi:Ca-activated chloride channel family protein
VNKLFSQRLLIVASTLAMIVALTGCSAAESPSTNGARDEVGSTEETHERTSESVLIMDASGSMGALVGDQTRSEVANDAFDSLIDGLRSDTVMGLVIMPGGCRSTLRGAEPTPLTLETVARYRQVVDDSTVVTPSNSSGPPATPVGDTLATVASLFSDNALERTMILISDGEEGCGNPPCEVAQQLIDEGFDVRVEAVGFQISDVGAEQLRCVAETTGGNYYDVSDASKLEEALKDAATGGSSTPWWVIALLALAALVVGSITWRFTRSS